MRVAACATVLLIAHLGACRATMRLETKTIVRQWTRSANESATTVTTGASSVEEQQSVLDLFAESQSQVVNLLDYECNSSTYLPRIAPLVFEDLGLGILMVSYTTLVKATGDAERPAMLHVWRPLALARHLASEDEEMLAALTDLAPYDVEIVVNTAPGVGLGFGFGGSDCVWSTQLVNGQLLFSGTSVLLHEVMHGMGIGTGLDAYEAGGLKENETDATGWGTSYDLLITNESGLPLLVDTLPSASSLAGRVLTVSGNVLYNPVPYQSGSSLSHFAWQGLMGHAIDLAQCEYTIQEELLQVIRDLGWRCPGNPGSYTWAEQAQEALTSITSRLAASSSGTSSANVGLIVGLICAGIVLMTLALLVWYTRHKIRKWGRSNERVDFEALPLHKLRELTQTCHGGVSGASGQGPFPSPVRACTRSGHA